MVSGKSHWESIYQTKSLTQVSWFQQHPKLSLEFIERTAVDKTAQIIDAGGGTSTLVDDLLANEYQDITVMDISASALQTARQRIGPQADAVTWLEADITEAALPYRFYEIWHDRAVFHFMTKAEDRERYIKAVLHSVKTGGHVIIATFALDGPPKCSGLEVVRYSPDSLQAEFGDSFELIDTAEELHKTPFNTEQKFIYCCYRKI